MPIPLFTKLPLKRMGMGRRSMGGTTPTAGGSIVNASKLPDTTTAVCQTYIATRRQIAKQYPTGWEKGIREINPWHPEFLDTNGGKAKAFGNVYISSTCVAET